MLFCMRFLLRTLFALFCTCFMQGYAADSAPDAVLVPYRIPNGVTPAATELRDDPREIRLSFPVTHPGARVLVAYRLRTYLLPQRIPAGAMLEYEIFYPADARWCNGAVELESSPRILFMLRGTNPGIKDADGMGTHPNNNLSRRAKGTWYVRRLALSPAAGKPFQNVFLGTEFTPDTTGTYSVSYRRIRILNQEGKLLWNLMPDPGKLPTAESELPVGGAVMMTGQTIVTLEPEKYLYRSGEKTKIRLSMKNADQQHPLTVAITGTIAGEQGEPTTLPSISDTLQPGEEKQIPNYADLSLSPGNYQLQAQVRIGESQGQVLYPCFTVSAAPQALPTPQSIRKQSAMSWGSNTMGFPSLQNLTILRERGGNFINLFVSWRDLEPEQGRYDFSHIDRVLADVARANLRAEIFFINNRPEDYPSFTHKEWMIDQKGGELTPRIGLSYWAPQSRPAYMQLLKALVTRYKGDARVLGYQPSFGGWGDGFYAKPVDGSLRIYDYSEFSQAKFRYYAREILGLSLEAIGKRYGQTYRSWEELRQPEPVAGIDRRPVWWDFQNYRVWSVEKMWEEVCATVRSVDQDCLIELCYGGSQEATGVLGNDYDVACRIARRYDAIIHNTCYEGYDAAPLLGSYSQRWGILHSCELAGTPAQYPDHQQGMFNILKFAPSAYCWIGGMNLDGIYPSYPLLRPVATELAGSQSLGKKLGLLESISFYQLCLKSNAVRYPRVRGGQLAAKLGLPVDLLTDRAFLEPGTAFAPETTPVVFLYGEPVLTTEAIDGLCQYAENGGAVVLFPQAGKYTPGEEKREDLLLRKLSLPEAAEFPVPGGRMTAQGLGPFKETRWQFNDVVPLKAAAARESWATLPDGSPAILTWRYGKGTVVLLGGSPDLADRGTREALRALFQHFGLVSSLSCEAPVESALKQKNGVAYAILHNPGNEETTSNIRLVGWQDKLVRLTNLLDGTSYGEKTVTELAQGIPIILPANTTTAIAVEPTSHPARSTRVYDYPAFVGAQEPAVIPHEYMNASMIACAVNTAETGAGIQIPFTTTADGCYRLALTGSGKLAASCKILVDGHERIPEYAEKATGWSLSITIPDLPRGKHVLSVVTAGEAQPTSFSYSPVLSPVESWKIVGPFPNRDGFRGKSFYEISPPENGWDVMAKYALPEKTLMWQTIKAPGGHLVMTDHYPFNPRTLAYAITEITAPRDCVLRLDCGIDYAFLLWVNDRQVIDTNTFNHGTSASEFGLNVALRKGKNTLAFKISPGGMGWSLHLRIGKIAGAN